MMLENRWLIFAELWEVTKSFSFFRASVAVFLVVIVTACSGSETDIGEADHIQVLEEIPEHIREIENLTIYQGDSEPRYSIELVPEQTYGEEGEPYLTTVLRSAVDDNGKIIILNSNSDYSQSVFVYNDDGTFHTELGRSGRGPGEHGFIFDVQARGGNVYIRDAMNQRINIYSSTDYSFDRTMMIEQLSIRDHEAVQELELGLILPRNDENYWVIFSDRRSVIGQLSNRYKIMDHEGRLVQDPSLALPAGFRIQTDPSARPIMPLYFMGSTLEAVSRGDELYTAFTRDFLIRKYDANGIYQSAFYYPVQSLPFDLDVHTNSSPFSPSARVIKNAFSDIDRDLPETNPVLFRMRIDDENRVWAAVPMDQQREILEWWILDESGELLAKLQRPLVKTIFDIKNGYLYGKEVDEETGAEYVVKYRMELTEE